MNLFTAFLLLAGCTDGDDTGGFVLGFTLEGTAVDFWNGNAPLDGEALNLCVEVADPTPALNGGDLETVASAPINADGTFIVEEIVTTSSSGVLMVVDDCDGGDVVQGTGTGIPADTLSPLDYGDVLSGAVAYVLVAETVDLFNADLAAVGYSGDLWTDGSMLGYVLDGTDFTGANPVGGATITTDADNPAVFFYGDGDASDGVFATGGATNAETSTGGNGLYIAPAAQIDYYSAEDGTDSVFYNVIGGSLPGLSLFMRIPIAY